MVSRDLLLQVQKYNTKLRYCESPFEKRIRWE